MKYPVENFNAAERELLNSYFTSLDAPVFGLINLPETVKGAMFARYSRYQGPLRRMFLDEFAPSLTHLPKVKIDGQEGERAQKLYDSVFLGYGDDSVAQLGGAHLACEWTSNLLTKVLQRGRIGAYLEQSTRYIPFDSQVEGRYRFYTSNELGPDYDQAMTQVFDIYKELLEKMTGWASEAYPRKDEPEGPWKRAIRAKALDLTRGLLPASALSHSGIYASGQAYELLIMRLLAHPSQEAKAYGRLMIEALKQIIPSFLTRIERPERGGEWVEYFVKREASAERWANKLELEEEGQGPSVKLIDVDGNELKMLSSMLFETSGAPEEQIRKKLQKLDSETHRQMFLEMVGERKNRRHKPGRGLESVRYRFEIVSDYGAFRDLQRHRLLTVQWQKLTPQLGAEIPPEVESAGYKGRFEEALEISKNSYDQLAQKDLTLAQYPLCLAYRMRYILDMNAREAMHLIELRSGEAGHPSYRAVALEMYRQVAEVHPWLGEAMSHLDTTTDVQLERIASEIRNEAKLQAKSQNQ